MWVEPGHPEGGNERLHVYARVFESWGARVFVHRGADNCIRRGAFGFEVHVEHLGNLLHEIAHALAAGRLADDHGFPYGAVPVDPTTAAGRRILFDELVAATLACSHRPGDPLPWYREQLEIQPVFYGYEANPAAFVDVVHRVVERHRAKLRAFERGIVTAFTSALERVGAPPWTRRAIWSISADGMWRTYVSTLAAGVTGT